MVSGPSAPDLPVEPGATCGAELGSDLIGLPSQVAFDRAARAGFDPRLVGPDGEAITADLKADRITLLLDEGGVA